MLEEQRIRTFAGGPYGWATQALGLTGDGKFPDEERERLTSRNQGAREILRVADLSRPRVVDFQLFAFVILPIAVVLFGVRLHAQF
jgi:hypothetical protein